MYHFDLSGNSFSVKESKNISEALKENKTIYGFHFEGNKGYTDELGFLIIPEDEVENYAEIHIKRKIHSV